MFVLDQANSGKKAAVQAKQALSKEMASMKKELSEDREKFRICVKKWFDPATSAWTYKNGGGARRGPGGAPEGPGRALRFLGTSKSDFADLDGFVSPIGWDDMFRAICGGSR